MATLQISGHKRIRIYGAAIGLVALLAGLSAGSAQALDHRTLLDRTAAENIEPVKIRLESPYDFGTYRHKVQLHSHSTNSDGDHSPQWVMQAYERLGYVAVAITDHDYGHHDPSLDDPGSHHIIHIPGVEYSSDEGGGGWNHMLGINIQTIHHADGIGARQAQIDQAEKEGGLTYLCHPYDKSVHQRGWCDPDILELVDNFTGIEIHNGQRYQSGGRDYPYKVDLALQAGKRVKIIAVDDFHRNPETTMDRGYVVINSNRDRKSITREEILSALKQGNYFAAGRVRTSRPASPQFTNISVDGRTITVQTDKKTDIEFITDRYNYYRDGPDFAKKVMRVTKAEYVASDRDKFIRIKATYLKDGQESYAWSNPIYVIVEQ